NIPGRSAVGLTLDTIKELSMHGNIPAIKEATGDLGFMAQIIEATEGRMTLLSGDDNLIMPVLSIGGQGVVSVIANVYPQETGAITRDYFANKVEEARKKFLKLLPLCKAMFIETNPIPVKYAASQKGLCVNSLRLPMTPLGSSNEAALNAAMQTFERG
ncbi:MAG TPA: dihydrodipicolinate synthase family protein, partial [Turneriella sp.]|nr:dihydrodipicolinate synthase family protein [Turneriella sp.]